MRLIDTPLCPLVNMTNLYLETASVETTGTETAIEGGTEVDRLETQRAGAIEAITDMRKGKRGEAEVAKATGEVSILLARYFIFD